MKGLIQVQVLGFLASFYFAVIYSTAQRTMKNLG